MDFEIFQLDLGLHAKDASFITISFILRNALLYLSNKRIVVAVSFFFSLKSCSLSSKLALSIGYLINDLLYHPF